MKTRLLLRSLGKPHQKPQLKVESFYPEIAGIIPLHKYEAAIILRAGHDPYVVPRIRQLLGRLALREAALKFKVPPNHDGRSPPSDPTRSAEREGPAVERNDQARSGEQA